MKSAYRNAVEAREYRALAVSLMVVAIMTVMLVLEAIR